MKSTVRIILLLACFYNSIHCFSQQTGKWGDQGDGTFRNPVIAADFSDPDPIRVDSDYYMVASTFESSPGVSVLHSKDLVNWENLGGVFQDMTIVDKSFYHDAMRRYNEGVYAPTIRYHDGKYWVFVNFYTDGFWMATAENPQGPWEISQINDKNGIPLKTRGWTDPCPFWDDNGKAYLAASRPGSKWYGYLFEMSPDGKILLDAEFGHMNTPDIVYEYPNGGTLISPNHSSEGNKIYKRNGYYYLVHIEFLSSGQGQGTYICRSRNIYGTKEDGNPGSPGNPGVYESIRIDRPMTANYVQELPGQGGLVSTPDDRWFWIAQFNRYNSDGRTPHLLPVTWVDDWPVIGTDIEKLQGKMVWQLSKPIKSKTIILPHGSDEFNHPDLNPQWSWNHQPRNDKWSLKERPGYLRLHAFFRADGKDFFKTGNVINQRNMRSDTAVVTVKLDLRGMCDGQHAGLTHFNGGKNYSVIAIVRDGNSNLLQYETQGEVLENISLGENIKNIYFRSCVGFNNQLIYQYSLDNKRFINFGKMYELKSGNYRGDMVGIYTFNDKSEEGYIDVDWFHYNIKNK